MEFTWNLCKTKMKNVEFTWNHSSVIIHSRHEEIIFTLKNEISVKNGRRRRGYDTSQKLDVGDKEAIKNNKSLQRYLMHQKQKAA